MENTVSQMTVSELRHLISEVVHEELAPLTDPDYGLELRDEVVERLRRQSEAVKRGERGIGLDELLTKLNIDPAEIEAEKDAPVAIS